MLSVEKEKMTYDVEYYLKHRKYYERGIKNFNLYLLDNFNFHSIIDIGCGSGDFVKLLENLKYVVGVDFSIGAKSLNTLNNYYEHDLTTPLNLKKKFDIVLSLEVFEHIPKMFEEMFIKNIINLASKYIIISVAPPRQWGRHHYNPKTTKYLISKFKKLGFKNDVKLTAKFKKIKCLASFYKKNTVVFIKK